MLEVRTLKCSPLQIRLEGSSLYLPQVFVTMDRAKAGKHKPTFGEDDPEEGIAYQLCACVDGSLFVTENDQPCRADYHVCNSGEEAGEFGHGQKKQVKSL